MTSRGSQRLSLSQSGLTGEAVNLGSRRFRSADPDDGYVTVSASVFRLPRAFGVFEFSPRLLYCLARC